MLYQFIVIDKIQTIIVDVLPVDLGVEVEWVAVEVVDIDHSFECAVEVRLSLRIDLSVVLEH